MLQNVHVLAAVVAIALCLTACSDPPDDTPLGQDCARIMARPEVEAPQVKVQHVLLAFVGAKRGSESKRTYAEARSATVQVLSRARSGDDFAALVKQHSGDDGDGIFTLTATNRADFAVNFAAISCRLAVGEVGVAAHHASKSPFGWHVIKRLE